MLAQRLDQLACLKHDLRRIEHRVDNVGVSRSHASLHHNHLLALVGIDDRHAGDRAIRSQLGIFKPLGCRNSPILLECDRVDRVIRANHERHIHIVKALLVDLVHL